jgi:hypothetical protein
MQNAKCKMQTAIRNQQSAIRNSAWVRPAPGGLCWPLEGYHITGAGELDSIIARYVK